MFLTLVGAYALILLAVFLFQRRLIYLPTRLTLAASEQSAAEHRVVAWRNPSGEVIGWQWPAPARSPAAVLVMHGNAGSALGRDYLAEPIRQAAGVDVFVLEYPGYGAREGSPSSRTILAAAEEAVDRLAAYDSIFVVGESLGAGAATHVAKTRRDRVRGLLLFAPYDRLTAVAQKVLPIAPMGVLLRDRYDPAAWLEHYRGPVVVVLAGSDEVIAPEFGRRLYDGYAGPKRLIEIRGAGHNDIPVQSTTWWKEIFSFWEQTRR